MTPTPLSPPCVLPATGSPTELSLPRVGEKKKRRAVAITTRLSLLGESDINETAIDQRTNTLNALPAMRTM